MDPLNIFKPYRSAYIDTGLPQIAQIRRERYDKAASEYDDLQRKIGSIRVLSPADEAHKNRLQMDIDSLMSGDIGFENMDRMIQNATTRVLTDEPLLNALDSYDVRKKELETIAKKTAEGKQFVRFDNQLKRDPITGLPEKDENGNPVYVPFAETHDSTQGIYQPKAEEYRPAEPEVQKIMQNIASDPIWLRDPKTRGLTPQQRMMYLMTGKEVSEDKVRMISENSLQQLLETEAGKQLKRSLTTLQINEATGDVYTPEEADMFMKQLLFDAAKKQVGSDVSYIQDAWMSKVLSGKDEEKKTNLDFYSSTTAGQVMEPFAPLNPEDGSGNLAKWIPQTLMELSPNVSSPRAIEIDAKKGKELVSKGIANNDLENENTRKQIVAYILNDTKDVNGLGVLRKTPGSGFENMSDEEFVKTVLKGMVTSPEVIQISPAAENKDVLLNDVMRMMDSIGNIRVKGEPKSFNMNSKEGRDAFYDYLKNDSGLDVEGISVPDLPIFGGTNKEADWFNKILKLEYKNGVSVVKEDEGREIPVKIGASVEYAGENAGEFRFLLDFQGQPLEVYYSVYKDQTVPFEIVRQIYKDINSKDITKWNEKKQLASNELMKQLFGEDSSYSYKVRPTKNGTFEPVFYKGDSPININWSDFISRMAQTATGNIEDEKIGQMMSDILQSSRPSTSTRD